MVSFVCMDWAIHRHRLSRRGAQCAPASPLNGCGRIMFAPAMWFVKIRLCGAPIANHVHFPSSIFNSPFRSRKISAPSIDRTAPQCYNKVILKKRKREVIYYEKP